MQQTTVRAIVFCHSTIQWLEHLGTSAFYIDRSYRTKSYELGAPRGDITFNCIICLHGDKDDKIRPLIDMKYGTYISENKIPFDGIV